MKTHLTYFIIITGLVLIILFFWDRIRKANEKNERQQSALTEKDAVIRYFQTTHGKTVAEKEAAILRADEIRDSYQNEFKRLLSDLKIKDANIRALSRSVIQAQASGQGKVIYKHDTINGQINTCPDSVIAMDGYLYFGASIKDNLPEYSYTYTDTVSNVFHVKKKWFLGKERLYASTMLSNPNAKVISSTNILVDQVKDKRFSVNVSLFYDPFENKVRPGIGVGYSLLKF